MGFTTLEHLDWQDFVTNLVTLWVVLDPVSTVPVFIALTAGMTAQRRRAVAGRAVLIAGAVLLFFIVAGQFLLEALRIPLQSFQIAGGIVLFLFALTMIFGPPSSEAASLAAKPEDADYSVAVYPLAIPAIAGPGAMLTVVLLTDNDRYSFVQQIDTVAMLCVVLLVMWLGLFGANLVNRVIGTSGANLLARVMGLILAAVAADRVLDAIAGYFNIGGSHP